MVPRGSAIHFHYIVLVLLLGWRKGGGKHHLGHRRAGPTASAFAAGGVTSGSWLALLLDEDLGVTAGLGRTQRRSNFSCFAAAPRREWIHSDAWGAVFY